MHESLDEFKFRPDTDTNTKVICPCASEKLLYNVGTTLAPSFLIGSSSYLQVMWRQHQPRFHPDLNRGLYRERVGVVLSAPIRSYHVLMSILTIGLIVENFLAAKKYPPINTIASTIGTIVSDRMTS